MKWFGKKKKEDISPESETVTRGLLIFADTGTVMRAEQILKEENYDIKVVSPPARYRTGCDLCVEFPLVEEPGIIRILKKLKSAPIEVVPESSNRLRPQKLCTVKDFGEYIMVRAANMKITVDKTTKRIVNISGGGCPDVPYLAYEMVGKSVLKAPKPSAIGHTLCAYALNTAHEELIELLESK
ncbi:MAG: DUF3343 domain-containing protein [Deltaproteobacteria bacterium]|jgi:hypothetical protein|nr:DUF3343 domain-containing protein [Deltaproteobacteria bacterium]